MKKRVRFGIKLPIPIFTNAGVVVFYTDEKTAAKLLDAMGNVNLILQLAGQGKIAERLVCDVQ